MEITEPYFRTKEPHNKINRTNRGIIFGVEDDISNDELSRAVGVRAERIMKKRGGSIIRTAQAILNYEGLLQDYVRIGWKRHHASLYIPHPTRCYNCQRYGHIATNCTAKKSKCPICAGTHPYQECDIKDTHRTENRATCPNCRGPHPASYQGCPAFKEAKMVKKIQTNEGISYADAVKQHKIDQNEIKGQKTNNQTRPYDVNGNTQANQNQYNIAKSTNVQAESQTDNTHAPSSESKTTPSSESEFVHQLLHEYVKQISTILARKSTQSDQNTELYKITEILVSKSNK